MAEKRVIEQTASSEIYNDDWFLKDSVLEGTTKISAENLAKGLIDNVDASDIAYDNSESGLTATNVQDAIDETFENAGKVDDVKVDGTSVVTNKVAEIEIPVKDVQVKTDSTYDSVVDDSGNAKIDLSSVTAYGEVPNLPQPIATFTDGADAPMKSLVAEIEPVQDLHGYDAPWVGGAGKNKLKVTATTQEISGVTFTVNEDGTVKANGTATDAIMLVLNTTVFTLPSGNYKISAGVSGTSGTTYFVCSNYASGQRDYTNDGAFTSDGSLAYKPSIYIVQGVTLSNVVFKPMIRLASVQDDTFAPYENICPITGYTEANVTRTGKNLWNNNWSAYTQPSDYRICPIKLENGQYTASVKLKEGGTRQSGFTLGIAKQGDRYTNFGSFYTASTGADKTGTITVDDAWTAPKLIVYCSNESAFNAIFENYEIQLELGTTATAYEPYAGTTYTIDLDGTRYGGELDVVNGIMTVDRVKLTNDYLVNTASYESASRGCFALIGITLKSMGSDVVDTKLMASALKTSSQNDLYTNKNIGIAHWWNTRIGFSTGDETITTVSAFKQWLVLNGSDVVYELATPLTIQLTSTQVKSLLGTNNIWADTGDINDCIYMRDMSSTIDDIIARLEALEG